MVLKDVAFFSQLSKNTKLALQDLFLGHLVYFALATNLFQILAVIQNEFALRSFSWVGCIV